MLKPVESVKVNFKDPAIATAGARSLQHLGFGWKTLSHPITSQTAKHTFLLSGADLTWVREIPASFEKSYQGLIEHYEKFQI